MTDGDDARVRPARREELDTLAAHLASAFEGDPLYMWMFGGREAWLAKREPFFRLFLAVHHRDGLVHTTEDLAGAALWTVPEMPFGGRFTRLTLGARLRRLLGPRAEVVRSEIGRLNAARPQVPHWYLPTLGVVPERQRRGIGTALMRPVLALADAAGLPCYLETSNPENLAFYSRLRFEITHEVEVEGGPPVWAMRREPEGP